MTNPPDPLLPQELGTLTTVTGPMFAGKTERLIETAHRYAVDLDRVLVVVPSLDTRHGEGVIRSHSGLHLCATANLRVRAIDTRAPSPLCRLEVGERTVLIDEAQFFGPDVLDWAVHLTRLQIRVYAFGLELDYRGEPFGLMPQLIQAADTRIRLHGECSQCQKPATRTHRTARASGQVLIGGADAYEPRCLSCWEDGRRDDPCALDNAASRCRLRVMVYRPTKPLNGTKTHPLTPHSLTVLYQLQRGGPIAKQEVNAGVIDRLDREALIDRIDAPSPYKKDRGALTPHLQITDAGRAALKAAGWENGEPRSR